MNAEEKLREECFVRDAHWVAVHEAGHLVVAHRLGHLAEFNVWTEDPAIDWRKRKQVGGKMSFTKGQGKLVYLNAVSNFDTSCVCWAGIVAEFIYGYHNLTGTGDFRREVEETLRQIIEASHPELPEWSDRVGILKHHQRWRTAKKACEILIGNLRALDLAVQKVRHDMVELRKSVTWVSPEDIGLTPHRIFTVEAA